MKILFILEAGIPEYRNFLFERLSKENDVTELLVIHNGRIYNGVGDYNSKKLKFLGNGKFGFYLGLRKFIRKYDVIISSYNLRIVSCWLPAFFNKKWIFWGKGLGSNEGIVIRILRQATARQGEKILVYNQYKKDELIRKLGISDSKVIAYNNTIDVSNAGIDQRVRKSYFIYFGRLQERKGLLELIREYQLYLSQSVKSQALKLRFVGNGDYKKVLEKEVDRLKLNGYVEFYAGVYDDHSIKQHFLGAKAYVSPYNVGLAVVNSFAYGVPVITCMSPQVGPEFHYLNSTNSIIVKNALELHNALKEMTDTESIELSSRVYDFFQNNITANVMYSYFYNAIKKVYNNE